jgi:hypothetical protein
MIVKKRSVISERLLREYIRQILLEDLSTSAEGPYGLSVFSASDMKKHFIDPFLNPFKVLKGKTKELWEKSKSAFEVSFKAISDVFTPGVVSNYNKIFEKEKEAISKIQSEYAEVYGKTWEAFKGNDIVMTALFCQPGGVIGAMLAKGGFDAAKRIAFGTEEKANEKMSDYARKMSDKLSDEEKVKAVKEKVYDKIKNEDKEKTSKLTQQSQQVVQNSLNNMYSSCEFIFKSKTLRELKDNLARAKEKTGFEDVKSKIDDYVRKTSEGMRSNDAKTMEQGMLTSLKRSVKQMYIDALQKRVDDAIKLGEKEGVEIREDNFFVKVHRTYINKIKSLN